MSTYSARRYMIQLSTKRDAETTDSLVKYYALLHYTGISHGTLATLYRQGNHPTRYQSLAVFFRQFVRSIAHPLSIAFIPVGLVHLPAYIAGSLAGRYLANQNEPETIAERKAVSAGLAFFATSASIGMKAYTFLSEAAISAVRQGTMGFLSDQSTTANVLASIGCKHIAPSFYKVLGMATAIVCTTWVLFRWHRALVPCELHPYLYSRRLKCLSDLQGITNSETIPVVPALRITAVHTNTHPRLQRTSAAWTIFTATWLPPSAALTSAQLASVRRPPLPTPNPFIKRRDSGAASATAEPAVDRDSTSRRPPSARVLVSHLFAARADAEAAGRRGFGGIRNPARA